MLYQHQSGNTSKSTRSETIMACIVKQSDLNDDSQVDRGLCSQISINKTNQNRFNYTVRNDFWAQYSIVCRRILIEIDPSRCLFRVVETYFNALLDLPLSKVLSLMKLVVNTVQYRGNGGSIKVPNKWEITTSHHLPFIRTINVNDTCFVHKEVNEVVLDQTGYQSQRKAILSYH